MSDASRREPSWVGRAGAGPASTGSTSLTEEQCWSYLRSQWLGRVVIVVDGRPHAFPVNFATRERSIVFRTDPGAKLEHGPGSIASFEIDGYDEPTRTGWSVMAFGRLEEITNSDDEPSKMLRSLPIEPLAPGAKLHWIALHVNQITGRRFTAGWIVPGAYFG